MKNLRLSTLLLAVAIAGLGLAYANPSFAGKKCDDDINHPSCKNDGESGDESTYSVEFTGGVDGQSADNWLSGFLGKNGIGLNDAQHPDGPDVGTISGLFLLAGIDDGATCFPSIDIFPNGSFSLHQAYIKEGRGGRADSWIWIHGFTITNDQEILYVLKLYGLFDPETAWPPSEGSHEITFTDWELVVEGGGRSAKNGSCSGEGTTNVDVTVTAIP